MDSSGCQGLELLLAHRHGECPGLCMLHCSSLQASARGCAGPLEAEAWR